MALLKSISDPNYAELPAIIERGMGLLLEAKVGNVELAEVLPLRHGRADRINETEGSQSGLLEDTNSVHVQIYVDQRPRYFARAERGGAAAGEEWQLTQISQSTIAESIEAGLEIVQKDTALDGDVVTLLEIPAYFFVGLVLSGDHEDRVLPVEFPKALGVDGSTIYSLEDIRELFRQSGILEHGRSNDQFQGNAGE